MISLIENLALPSLYIEIFITILSFPPTLYAERKKKTASRLQQKRTGTHHDDVDKMTHFLYRSLLCVKRAEGVVDYLMQIEGENNLCFVFRHRFASWASERERKTFFHESRNRTNDDSTTWRLLHTPLMLPLRYIMLR